LRLIISLWEACGPEPGHRPAYHRLPASTVTPTSRSAYCSN